MSALRVVDRLVRFGLVVAVVGVACAVAAVEAISKDNPCGECGKGRAW